MACAVYGHKFCDRYIETSTNGIIWPCSASRKACCFSDWRCGHGFCPAVLRTIVQDFVTRAARSTISKL